MRCRPVEPTRSIALARQRHEKEASVPREAWKGPAAIDPDLLQAEAERRARQEEHQTEGLAQLEAAIRGSGLYEQQIEMDAQQFASERKRRLLTATLLRIRVLLSDAQLLEGFAVWVEWVQQRHVAATTLARAYKQHRKKEELWSVKMAEQNYYVTKIQRLGRRWLGRKRLRARLAALDAPHQERVTMLREIHKAWLEASPIAGIATLLFWAVRCDRSPSAPRHRVVDLDAIQVFGLGFLNDNDKKKLGIPIHDRSPRNSMVGRARRGSSIRGSSLVVDGSNVARSSFVGMGSQLGPEMQMQMSLHGGRNRTSKKWRGEVYEGQGLTARDEERLAVAMGLKEEIHQSEVPELYNLNSDWGKHPRDPKIDQIAGTSGAWELSELYDVVRRAEYYTYMGQCHKAVNSAQLDPNSQTSLDISVVMAQRGPGINDYVASSQYQGPMFGFVFKFGMRGRGYYWDYGYDDFVAPFAQDGDFISREEYEPSSRYLGFRQGYTFQIGELGLGYYVDTGLQTSMGASLRRFCSAEKHFGTLPGCIYQLGEMGLGYYTDTGRASFVHPFQPLLEQHKPTREKAATGYQCEA